MIPKVVMFQWDANKSNTSKGLIIAEENNICIIKTEGPKPLFAALTKNTHGNWFSISDGHFSLTSLATELSSIQWSSVATEAQTKCASAASTLLNSFIERKIISSEETTKGTTQPTKEDNTGSLLHKVAEIIDAYIFNSSSAEHSIEKIDLSFSKFGKNIKLSLSGVKIEINVKE